jgi:hypothetical protein
MATDLHHCGLTGVLERDPITRFADHGTQMTGFPRTRTEPGPAGQEFRLVVPVERYSQGAEQASDLSAGDSVVVAGKLQCPSWTTTDGLQKTSLAVLARPMKVLTPASVTTDDDNEETTPLSRSSALKPHHRDGWR